jgi:four helix bundle protein
VGINSHRDLVVWQKSMRLAKEVYQLAKQLPKAEEYRLTSQLPKAEEYRLTSQLLRAVTSVATNVAEGHARGTRRDYANFVSIARGSLAETETILLQLVDIELLTNERAQTALALCSEIGKMLNGLLARLRDTSGTRPLKPDP